MIAGLCGALIGYAFADNQCVSNCTNWKGIGLVVGALVGAVGVAIVAVLALRAMDEWQHNVDIERAALDRKLPDQDLARGTDPDPSDPDPTDPE